MGNGDDWTHTPFVCTLPFTHSLAIPAQNLSTCVGGRARLAVHPESTLARLDGNTIQEMAVLLETTLTDLTSQLALFAPNTALTQDPTDEPNEESDT